jgi:hypothetical protein
MTWQEIAADLGAWGVYRADTGVTVDGSDGIISIADQSGNGRTLTDTYATTTKRAISSAGLLVTDLTAQDSFRGTHADLSSANHQYGRIIVAVKEVTAFGRHLINIYQENNTSTAKLSGVGESSGNWATNLDELSGTSHNGYQLPGTATPFIVDYSTSPSTTTAAATLYRDNIPIRTLTGSSAQGMNIIGFGSRADKGNFGSDAKIAAWVILADNRAHLNNTDAIKIARMKQLMLAEFS